MAEPQNGSLDDLVGMGGPKFRLNKPDLPKTEALFAGPAQAREGFVTAEQAAPALAEQRAEEARLTREVGQADVAIEAAKLERDRLKAEQKGALVKKQKQELELLPEAQQLKQKREQFTNLTFVPTRDNAEDLAKLFSLIGVIGVAIGGRGRGAALQAMTSMNGMLEGYRRGRADLYKQQLGEFDRSLKTIQQQISTLEKQLTEAVKLKALDREAGELAIDAAIASADSPLLKAIAAKQGPVAALAHVRATGKDFNTLITLKNQQQDRAEQRQARLDAQKAQQEFQREERLSRERFQAGMQQSQQAFQRSMLDLRLAAAAEIADKKAAGAAQKIPMQVSAQNTLRNNLIPKIEEALPVLDRLQKEGKWTKLTSLLAVDSRLAEAAFTNDKEALNLILTLAYFRSKEFETAGKALTRKEDQILAPIVRGDLRTYQGIKNAMEVGLKTLKQEQGGLEAVYPSLKVYNDVFRQQLGTTGTPSFASEAEAQAAFDRGEIQAGAKIKIGNQTGTWQPK